MKSHSRLEGTYRDILLDLAVLINARRSVTDVFASFATRLLEVARFDYASLVVFEADRRFVRLVGAFPSATMPPADYRVFPARDIGILDLEPAERGFEFDPARAERVGVRQVAESGLRRLWAIPLLRNREFLGAFTVGRTSPEPFQEVSLEFLRLAASLLASAVHDEVQLSFARQDAARSALLNELAVVLNAGESTSVVFDRMCGLLEQAIPSDYVSLIVRSSSDDSFNRVGVKPEHLGFGDTLTRSATGIDAILATGSLMAEFRTDRIGSPWAQAMHAAGINRFVSAVFREGDEPLGLLALGRRLNLAFNPSDLAFMETMTTLLGQSVTNRRLLERAEAAAARNELLSELAVLLNVGEPVDALFDRVPALLERAVPLDYVGLSVVDRPGWLRIVDARPEIRLGRGGLHPLAESQVDEVLATGGSITQWRTDRVEGAWPDAYRQAGFARMASSVLKHGDETHGVLVVGRRANLEFSPHEASFLDLVTTLLTQAVANQRRLERAESAAARNKLLNELAVLLNAGQPVETVGERMLALLKQALDIDYAGLWVADRRDGRPQPVGRLPGDAPDGPEFTFDSPGVKRLIGSGLNTGQYHPDQTPGPGAAALAAGGFRRGASALLHYGPSPVGLLTIARRADARFLDEDLAFLDVVATLLGQAVANQRRLERAESAAARNQLLNELAVLLSAGQPAEALFDRVQEVMLQAVDADYVSLLLGSKAGGDMRLVGSRPWIALPGRAAVSSREAGAENIVASGERVTQYRTDRVDLAVTRLLAGAGIVRVAAAVVSDAGGAFGILNMGRRSNIPFSPEDIAFVEVVATLLGQAEASQQRVARAREETEEQRIVAEVAAAAARETSPTKLISALVPAVRSFVPRPFLGFVYPRGDQGLFLGRDGSQMAPLTALGMQALETGQASAPELAPFLEPGHPAAQYGLRAIAYTVAESGGEGVGMLIAASREEGFVFRERELRLLKLVAQIVGPAIASATAAEQTARERALYDFVLHSLSEAVILLDRDFHTVFANGEGLRIVDAIDPGRELRTAEDHLPRLPGEARESFLQATIGRIGSRGRAPLRIDGDVRWYDFEIVPLDHAAYRVLVVASDVTAEVGHEAEREQHREQMEQASRLAALGELIGGVAHELNNPLTAILGFTELVAREQAAAAFSEELDIVHKEATRARNIVRDLLFIARPGPVERGEVAVRDVVGHIERLRRATWAKEGIAVNVEMGKLDRPVWGNEHQLAQVLLNLVTNAEHAVRGVPAPRIDISAVARGDRTIITVADNGHGMDAAILDRIFEPFFTTKQGYGTGLGLSLSYTIVAAHGGGIEVASSPGEGTRFTVTLPFHGGTVAVEEHPGGAAPARRARVLVVDDDANVGRVCQRLIESMGHDCHVAANSAEALELAAGQPFDLVVCDYRLGEETAGVVVAGLARVAPGLVARTVIATGATTDAGVVELSERHGLRLMAKPYGRDELAELIEAAPPAR